MTQYLMSFVPEQTRGAEYQTMMNEALKAFLERNQKPATAAILRQIIREELPQASRPTRRLTGRAKTARR